MFRASTPMVIRNTPAQASCCHSVNGLIAKRKIVTGRLAIGLFRSLVQNWLDSAVNSSGAVSPAIRATASSTPVTMPAYDDLTVIAITIFHFGVPRATAASRSAFGTRFSMFSVVRTTMGICSSASAQMPAQPEKCPMRVTTSA
ncbi:hypothetical protein D3C87_1365660 [compost metagenome]